jgi:hypothetical protein
LTRLPVAGFAALVVATIAAFFVTQHLKVTTPLLAGDPRPSPAAFNPVSGHRCEIPVPGGGQRVVSFRRTRISFYLLHRADVATVSVIDQAGNSIATVAANRRMRVGVRDPDGEFVWNGRESDGRFAPPGTYYFQVFLQQQGRSINLNSADQLLHIVETAPRPRVIRVQVTGARAVPGSGPAIIAPPRSTVTIDFVRGAYRSAFIQIYRTDLPGKPQVVKSFQVNGRSGRAVWNGLIGGRPAPAGTYLVGMRVTNAACNPGTFPVVDPPSPGTTPHAGVTVRYLAAEVPLAPVPAGSTATVYVDSRLEPYTWSLQRSDGPGPLEHGRVGAVQAAAGQGVALRVRMPPFGAGLYELTLRSGSHSARVPLIAAAAGAGAAARVLVVVPALTWQGENPVDDDGSGLPATLAAGDQVNLSRPYADGLPAGFGSEAALLAFLDRRHLPYQLTSDVALAEGTGPALAGHHGVILDGSLAWLPSDLAAPLKTFVQTGGVVLSVGVHSLESIAPLRSGASGTIAGPPSSLATDPFGAGHGSVTPVGQDLITVIHDPLHLFSTTSGAFTGYASAQAITPPSGTPAAAASTAGVADGTPSIIGFRLAHGLVVEVGLPGFGSSLYGNFDAQSMMARIFALLR